VALSIDAFGDITPTVGIVTLTEAKTHLRYPNPSVASSDDAGIQGFIYAATEVIEDEVGKVVQRQVAEYHDGGQVAIYLRQKPVLEVVSVVENWGYFNWELADQPSTTVPATNLFAYSLDNPAQGRVTRRSVGNIAIPFMSMGGMFPNNIQVTYIAGRNTVPWAVRLATLELIAHWWQHSQQRQYSAGGSLNSNFDDEVEDSSGSAYFAGVPYAILEMVKPHRRAPIIG
jgi:hypothetical protein